MGFKSIVSVVTPATTFDLTNLLKVLAALDINDATPAQKVWLRTAIKQCSAAAARECNRVFALQSYSESFYPIDCPSSCILQLARWPTVEVTTVTEDGTVLVDGTDFVSDPETGQLVRLCGGIPTTWAAISITVEYDAGYDPIPDDLADIVHGIIQGQWLAISGERDPFLRAEDIPGVASYQYATLSTTAETTFSNAVRGKFDSYKSQLFV